jgi:glycosyltransferase involved in cell wall biosynthesis
MKTPLISVIIPSYNKVEYISKTLDSILRQNYSNYEIIVQDGKSTDGTFEIVQKYAKKFPQIFRIESKIDKGQTSAINSGLGKAKGELVTYINADDVYLPDTLQTVAREYQANPEALWFAGSGKVINRKGHEIAKPSTWYKNFLLSLNSRFCLLITNYFTQPSVFLTKKTFQKYGPFSGLPNGVVMEYSLWLKLSKVTMPKVLDQTLSAFRITTENISSISYKNILKEDEAIVKKFTKNKLILLLHKLNNLMRVVTIRVINS